MFKTWVCGMINDLLKSIFPCYMRCLICLNKVICMCTNDYSLCASGRLGNTPSIAEKERLRHFGDLLPPTGMWEFTKGMWGSQLLHRGCLGAFPPLVCFIHCRHHFLTILPSFTVGITVGITSCDRGEVPLSIKFWTHVSARCRDFETRV